MLLICSLRKARQARSRYEGTGLGLAITKQLVDRMDGSIELKSKVGVGTTVIVKIPFKIGTQDENSNLSDKSVSLDDYSVEGMRALVVEDNELNMEIARCILEESGMEVTCAADGKEAVEIFEKSEPDYFGVIYMDIMMPRLNGLDAARTIREMKRRDAMRVPIIAMVRKCLCRRYYQQPAGRNECPSCKAAGCGKNDRCLKTMHGR